MNREQLQERIRRQTAAYDETLQLIRTPLTATYHTALKSSEHPEVYALLSAASYAYDLLESGEAEHIARANGILERVVPLQDRNPSSDTYGIWPYFFEEPLEQMDRPDWNMADFHGKRLILILMKHRERLRAELAEQIEAAISHACRAIIIRNVGPHYTNIAIMGAFVTLVGGELLQVDEYKEYGLARLKRFYDFTFGIGTFSEYNSPCYTPIAIRELHSITVYSASAEAVAYANELIELAWKMAGEHFHAGTGEWSGPHSRTYSTLLQPDDRKFLYEALLEESFEFGENIRCPKAYRGLFQTAQTRYVTEATLMEADTGYQVYATLFQNKRLSLGTFSKGVMWNQRRNMLAYVNVEGEPVYVQLQFLKDGGDFCSAMFASVQARTNVLFGFNLLTDNGAWHSDLDQINGRFRSSDLRIRLKIGGVTTGLELPEVHEGKAWQLRLGEASLAVKLLHERSDYGELELRCERTDDAIHADYVLYSGEEREFDFHAVQESVWLFQLALNESGQLPAAQVSQVGDLVKASAEMDGETASVALSISPGETMERYLSNKVELPNARLRSKQA